MNISSIIIQTLPQNIESVLKAINESDFCDYELHNEIGKIVVTLEGKDAGEEIEKLIKIQQIPHVIAADMHMTYSEDELDREMKTLENGDVVPAMLNDPDIKPKDIVYGGDLKKKNLPF